jgi:hypothetical protein
VFSGRYKAPPVDGSGNGYLRTAAEYVHLNPVRARLVKDQEPLSVYPWSSYPAYLQRVRPPWLRVDRVMGEYGIPGDTAAGRRRFGRVLEQRRFQADGKDYRALRRGWFLGGEDFRQELLAQTKRWLGPNHFGSERRETVEEMAQRIIAEAIRGARLTKEQLALLPANASLKIELARRLRRETTVSLKWIARELGVGSWKYLSNLLLKEQTNAAQTELGI